MSWIKENDFTIAISSLPLVSIDLIVKNSKGLILLGKRKNPPARGTWFVPGGRIRRMENFKSALTRISKAELGASVELEDTELVGLFEHMYRDSAFSDEIGSHYVSIGLEMQILGLDSDNLPGTQHSEYCWFGMGEIMDNNDVHQRTKEFFKSGVGIRTN
jgi:colanic acid biosynthesis protein WcaH